MQLSTPEIHVPAELIPHIFAGTATVDVPAYNAFGSPQMVYLHGVSKERAGGILELCQGIVAHTRSQFVQAMHMRLHNHLVATQPPL